MKTETKTQKPLGIRKSEKKQPVYSLISWVPAVYYEDEMLNRWVLILSLEQTDGLASMVQALTLALEATLTF